MNAPTLTQIDTQLKSIGEALDLLHDQINSLNARLSGVTRIFNPHPTNPEVIEKEETLVPLAYELSKISLSILSAEIDINSILERLEL
jgi:prefoldin subunit 5